MRFKEVKKLINEQTEAEQLFEVNMSPSNLAKLANQIDARAGMEFEMIVPDTQGSDEDGELEPDYDQDESVGDIEDACNFFYDGDYNGRREIDRLRESMQEDYANWVYEKRDEDWHSGNGFEFFQEYLDREDPYDRDEGLDDARDYVRENDPDLEPGSDEFSEAVTERLNEMEANYVQEQWDEQGRNYDYAREEFDSEKQDDYSQSDWLDDAGYRTMSDITSNYDITWPHYTSVGNGSGRSIEDIADDFSRAIGRPVNSSTSYHGARRKEGTYVVEPDGSLEGDNPGDTGLEFVSPPLPLPELLSDLKKVQKWAKSEGCYTGADYNTGLHINVSVPGLGAGQENLDYVKLALLLGDEHVLKEFERTSNTYCKSGLGIVKKNIKDNPENAKALLDQMKSGLEQMASRAIHGAITNKFTSINTKDGYVEFRSPGGDWLNDKFDKIEPTLLRFVVALDAAVKPDLYRQEYLKKLYKALEPAGNKNTIDYFTRYVAGEIPQAALKSFVRQAQLERNLKAGKVEGKMWWSVGRPGYFASVEVVASSKEEAIEKGKKEYPDWANAKDMTAEPLRPYEGTGLKATVGEPQPIGQQTVSGLYKIFSASGQLIAGDEYGSDQAALARAQHWARQRGVDVVVKNAQGEEIGRVSAFGEITPTAQQLVQQDQGNWGIWIDANNRFANQPGTYARGETPPLYRFPSREAAEQWIEQQRAARPDMRTDIDVREIPPRLLPGSTLDLQRQRAEQEPQGVDTRVDYEIYDRQTGSVIRSFQARNDDEAMVAVDDYRDHGDHGLARNVADHRFGVRRGPGVTNTQTNVNSLRPTGPGPWEVANRQNNQVYFNPEHTNRAAAETEARTWLSQNGYNPNDFEVRTRESVYAPRTLTTPGQGQQVFTGEWKVVDNAGRELYRFSGVGNSQADANRVAAQWAQRNMVSDEVNVVPVMGAA